jgi:acetyl coenzyme A synthetase (ADP forming)-like protein
MSLLSPSSVAVIGASSQEGKVGHDVLKNLLTQGYGGKVFPVNPKGGEILGATVYASIKDIPETPDLAVIVIPAVAVPGALTECGEKGIKNVVIISAGFGEVHTDEGKKLEDELLNIAGNFGITLIGPNCLGIVRPSIKLNASFAKDLPPTGNIALVSQSGAMGVALMDGAVTFGLGLSAFISIGNKALTDEADMLELFAKDPETKVIGLYLESIKDGRRFMQIARDLSPTKHIVLLKAGVSEHGRKAASSHTGALAGSDSAIEALCAQTGIHRAHTTEEFMDLLSVLSMEPPLLSDRIAIVTNAGGPGILATDAAESVGLKLPSLTTQTMEKLKPLLPAAASMANPIDAIGDADTARYEAAFSACQKDPNIDGIIVLLTPQVMTPCADIARAIVKLHRASPLIPVVCAFMGGESVQESKKILREAGIPTFATPERAVHAMSALRVRTLKTRSEMAAISPKASEAEKLIAGKKGLLDEDTTKKLFELYGLPMPGQALAKTSEEAVRLAEKIGYPVIAKISSPQILHKTDIGGVRANIKNAQEAALAFRDITAAAREHMPEATVNGVLIQQFLPIGNEFIVGCVRDPSFGPLIMAGLGGIYTELFRDTSFRIAPVTTDEAYDMLNDLQAWKLLLGMRGAGQSDIDAFAGIISVISQMVHDCPSIIELDLNPVLVGSTGIVIADVKVVIG